MRRVRIRTSRTVPGQRVMRVLSTKRMLNLIRFMAPIERELASVNSFECSSITRKIKYKRRNIGRVSTTSRLTDGLLTTPCKSTVAQLKFGVPFFINKKSRNFTFNKSQKIEKNSEKSPEYIKMFGSLRCVSRSNFKKYFMWNERIKNKKSATSYTGKYPK